MSEFPYPYYLIQFSQQSIMGGVILIVINNTFKYNSGFKISYIYLFIYSLIYLIVLRKYSAIFIFLSFFFFQEWVLNFVKCFSSICGFHYVLHLDLVIEYFINGLLILNQRCMSGMNATWL